MIFNNEAIPLLNFKNGDIVTALLLNLNTIKVFTKFNFLNPSNVGIINTGIFYDHNEGLHYLNYCGWHYANVNSTSGLRRFEMDSLIKDLREDINEIISKYKGD